MGFYLVAEFKNFKNTTELRPLEVNLLSFAVTKQKQKKTKKSKTNQIDTLSFLETDVPKIRLPEEEDNEEFVDGPLNYMPSQGSREYMKLYKTSTKKTRISRDTTSSGSKIGESKSFSNLSRGSSDHVIDRSSSFIPKSENFIACLNPRVNNSQSNLEKSIMRWKQLFSKSSKEELASIIKECNRKIEQIEESIRNVGLTDENYEIRIASFESRLFFEKTKLLTAKKYISKHRVRKERRTFEEIDGEMWEELFPTKEIQKFKPSSSQYNGTYVPTRDPTEIEVTLPKELSVQPKVDRKVIAMRKKESRENNSRSRRKERRKHLQIMKTEGDFISEEEMKDLHYGLSSPIEYHEVQYQTHNQMREVMRMEEANKARFLETRAAFRYVPDEGSVVIGLADTTYAIKLTDKTFVDEFRTICEHPELEQYGYLKVYETVDDVAYTISPTWVREPYYKTIVLDVHQRDAIRDVVCKSLKIDCIPHFGADTEIVDMSCTKAFSSSVKGKFRLLTAEATDMISSYIDTIKNYLNKIFAKDSFVSKAFHSAIETFMEYSELIENVAHVFAYLTTFSVSTNWIGRASYTKLLIDRLCDWVGIDNASNWKRIQLTTLLTSVEYYFAPKKVMQTEGEYLTKVVSYAELCQTWMNSTLNSEAAIHLRNLIIAITTLKWLPLKSAQSIWTILGKPEKNISMLGVWSQATDDIVSILKAVKIYAQTGDWRVALRCGSDLEKLMNNARELLLFEDRLYYGTPQPDRMYYGEYMRQIQEVKILLQDKLENFKETDMKSNTTKYIEKNNKLSLKELIKRLAKSYENIEIKRRSEERLPPLVVVISGPPSIGKGFLIRDIPAVYAKVANWAFHPSMIWGKAATTEYYDKYHPPSHPFMFFSEVGAESDVLTGKKTEFPLVDILSMVDTNSMPLNVAFEGKGELYFGSVLIMLDTNHRVGPDPGDFLHIKKIFKEPAAALRRLIVVDVTCLEEYRKNGSTAIDPAKCNDGTHPLNRYSFKVMKFLPTESKANSGVAIHTIGGMTGSKTDNIFKLRDTLETVFRDHLNNETNVRHMIDKPITPGLDFSRIYMDESTYLLRKFMREKKFGIVHNHVAESLSKGVVDQNGRTARYIMKGLRPVCKSFSLTCMSMNRFFDYNKHFAFMDQLDVRNPLIEEVKYDIVEGKVKRVVLGKRRLIEKVGLLPYKMGSNSMTAQYGLLIKEINDLHRTYIQMAIEDSKKVMQPQSNEEPAPITEQGDIEDVGFRTLSFKSTSRMVSSLKAVKSATEDMFTSFMFALITFVGTGLIDPLLDPILCMFIISMIPLCIFNYFNHLVVVCVTVVFLSLLKYYVNMSKEKSAKHYAYYMTRAIAKLKGYNTSVVIDCMIVVTFFSVLASVLKSVVLLVKPKSRPTMVVESSNFKLDSEHNVPLNKTEDDIGAYRSFKRLPNKAGEQWVNTIDVRTSGLHTSNPVDLWRRVSRNLRPMLVIGSDGTAQFAHCLGVSNNYAILNTHMYQSLEFPIEIRFYNQSTEDFTKPVGSHYIAKIYKRHDFFDMGNDITLILTDLLFKDISKHFPRDSEFTERGEYCLRQDVLLPYHRCVRKIANEKMIPTETDGFITTHDHRKGLCGLPYLIKKGQGWTVAGIHTAGLDGQSFAARVSGPLIEKGKKYFDDGNHLIMASEGELRIETTYPIPQSCLFYENFTGATYFGKEPGAVNVNGESSLQRNKIYDMSEIHSFLFEKFSFTPKVIWEKPLMKVKRSKGEYLSPYNVSARKMSHDHKGLDEDLLKYIIKDEIRRNVVNFKSKHGEVTLNPLDIEHAINGDLEDAFISRINASTSAGHSFPGNKGQHIPIVDESNNFTIREPVDKLKSRIREILSCYERSETACHIYNVALKDEPRDWEKVKLGKTRLFYVAPIDLIIVSRMLFAPFYSMFADDPYGFNTAIGINMHKEAEDVYNFLIDFSELICESDYQTFDLGMLLCLRRAAYLIQKGTLKELGYGPAALKLIDGLITDLLYPIFSLCKDLVRVPGNHPSGGDGTAQHNSLVNKLMVRYFFEFVCREKGIDTTPDSDYYFYKKVRPMTLGDDLLTAVKRDISNWFNNITYSNFCYEFYGMKCTPAVKGAEFTEFVTKEDMCFLKRTFSYHKDLKRIVGKLDLDSLLKTLTFRMPSPTEPEEYQVLSAAGSVMKEFVFHSDRETYNEFYRIIARSLLKYKCFDEAIIRKSLLTYDQQLNALSLDPVEEEPEVTTVLDHPEIWITESETTYPYSHCVAHTGDDSRINIVSKCNSPPLMDVGVHESSTYPASSQENVINGLKDLLEELDNKYEEQQKTGKHEMDYEEYMRRRTELLSAIRRYTNVMETEGDTLSVEDIVSRIDNGACYRDQIIALDWIDLNLDLPIEIYTAVHKIILRRSEYRMFEPAPLNKDDLTAYLEEVFSVESELLEQPGGKTEEQNMINIGGDSTEETGTSKTRGNTFISDDTLELDMFPMRPVRIASYVWTNASTFAVGNHRPWNVITADQALRAKFKNKAFIRASLVIEANLSGGPLHRGKVRLSYLPFANYNPMDPIMRNYPIDNKNLTKKYLAQSPFTILLDPRDNKPQRMKIPWIAPAPMARLFTDSTSSIANTSAFTDVQDLGVLYVIVQNTILNSSNAANFPDVTLEIFGWLEDVELGGATATQVQLLTESELKKGPIESYAMSTAKFMKSLSDVPVIGPYAKASEMAMKGLGTLAAHHGWSEPQEPFKVQRVRQDGYFNEAHVIGQSVGRKLTLDPLQETSIDPSVCGVDTDQTSIEYLSNRWGLLTTFRWETTNSTNVMFSCMVNPGIAESDYLTTGYRIIPTPTAYATNSFNYWRGDMEFKIEPVKGGMDRGKFSIKYEPNVNQSTLILAAADSLNKQDLALVDIAATEEFTFTIKWNHNYEWLETLYGLDRVSSVNKPTYAFAKDKANGFIYIRPFTKLVTPDDDGIDVNVYVRMKNVKVAHPTDAHMPRDRRTFATQSQSVDLVDYGASDEKILTDYFGETVPNLRMLIKRYKQEFILNGQDYTIPATKGGGIKFAIPLYNLIDTFSGPFIRADHWDYLRPAFLGFKGSVRFRVTPIGLGTDTRDIARVSLGEPTVTNTVPSPVAITDYASDGFRVGSHGTSTFIPATHGMEFDVPYYNRNLFLPSQPHTGASVPNMFKSRYLRHVDFTISTNNGFNNTNRGSIVVESAVGEDFIFMMFLGAPVETELG